MASAITDQRVSRPRVTEEFSSGDAASSTKKAFVLGISGQHETSRLSARASQDRFTHAVRFSLVAF